MWFIGVEVEQETSAPPPKKNPGSAPARGLYFSKALFERPISGGAYIRREICVSKSAKLILGGKFASQNRLG